MRPSLSQRSIKNLHGSGFFFLQQTFLKFFQAAAVGQFTARDLLRGRASEVAAIAVQQPERIGVQEAFS